MKSPQQIADEILNKIPDVSTEDRDYLVEILQAWRESWDQAQPMSKRTPEMDLADAKKAAMVLDSFLEAIHYRLTRNDMWVN